ncbi:MAG: sensor histidine kinase [Halobacteriales archaeon]
MRRYPGWWCAASEEPMFRRVNPSGLVIAGIGFFITRFTVTLAIYDDPIRFYLAGVAPLVLGLGLAAFGVALVVADVDAETVRTTAAWCAIGFATMLVLVLLTLAGSQPSEQIGLSTIRSQAYLSNFLIGGSVGGTMTGLYAARNRHQRRALALQANRLEILNRILRHEVLNAVTAIRGYATAAPDESTADAVIADRSEVIQRTIDEVKHLTRRAGDGEAAEAVRLREHLEASVEAVASRHPEVDVHLDDVPTDLVVLANDRLPRVFVELLENAVVHGRDDTPRLEVDRRDRSVTVRVVDRGPGLPADQRRLLESGAIERFDDPTSGFGLNVVHLLVESYGGAVETDVDPGGTRIEVDLPRASPTSERSGPNPADLARARPAMPHLVVALGAALVAGVVYGAVSETLGGSIAAIGVFYGIEDAFVGWFTHELHSVVFGFIYVGLLSVAVRPGRASTAVYLGVAVAWALVLWLGAAGVIAPLWLRLLGIPAAVPNVSTDLLWSHLAWGVSLGLLTRTGYRRVLPWTARLRQLLPGRIWARVVGERA